MGAPNATTTEVLCLTTTTRLDPTPVTGRQGISVYNHGPNPVWIVITNTLNPTVVPDKAVFIAPEETWGPFPVSDTVYVYGITSVNQVTGAACMIMQYGGLFTLAPYTLEGVSTDTVPFTVDGVAGQTADIQQWAVNGSTLASIDYNGNLHTNIAWDDVQGPANQGTGTAALTAEVYRDTPYVMLFMRHDQDDTLSFALQMTHTWIPDTEVRVHIHYVPMVTPPVNQVVYIRCQYAWAITNSAIPPVSGWTTVNTSITIPTSGADTFDEKITTLFSTTPTGAKESAVLMLVVTRLGTNINDTYTTSKATGTAAANFGIVAVDAHFQCNKLGTPAEFPV